MTLDFLCRALRAHRRADDARDDHDHARRDGRGRHPRPARRRLRPLLDRRVLARPPLREDALRPRAAHARVPARFLVTGEPRYRRVVEDTSATCCATCADPDGGFYSAEDADSEGVEGKFYLLVARRDPRGVRRRRRRGDRATSASPTRGNFVDPHTSYRGNILHVVDRNEPEPGRGRRAAARCCSSAASTRSGPGSTTRCSSGGTRCSSRALAEAAAALDRDDWMDAARDERRVPARASCARRRPPPAARGRRARTSRTPRTTPRCSRRCSRSPRSTTSPGSPRRASSPTTCSRLFLDDEARRLLHHRRRRRGAHRAAEGLFDNATPSANSLAANGLLRLATLTGERALRRARRSRSSRCSPARWRHTRPGSRTCSARSSVTCAPRSRSRSSATRADARTVRAARRGDPSARPGVGDARRAGRRSIAIPLLADRPGARRADRVRVRALRVPEPVTEPEALARSSTPCSRRADG